VTKSVIPGSAPGGAASGILPGIHIYFPQTLVKDPNNKASNPINIVGIGVSVSLGGSPTFQVDQTLLYHEECQIYLCYLVEFDSANNIPAGKIEVQVQNLLNPESVAVTGNVIVTTLMKYTGDPRYYKID